MPSDSPIRFHSTNSAGSTQRATGRWCVVGRRYWPIVTMSTPTPAKSARQPTISSCVSPIPTINPDFVASPAALARDRTDKLRAYPADGRTARWRRATVSMLWFSTSGRTANSKASESASPFASEINVSIRVSGHRRRTASTQRATWAMPPSGRSSRATIVSTACAKPMVATASATRAGSSSVGGSGLLVSTRQKPQARVHRSPRTMNVAVPSAQQSLRLGQPASSHTVTRPRFRTVFLSAITSGPCTTLGRSQSGLRVAISRPSATPTCANRLTTAPGPSPRENADKSSGRCFQATSCRSIEPPPHTSAAWRATTSVTASSVVSTPSSASEVTGLSGMPQGTM